jgi:uncharacterized protein
MSRRGRESAAGGRRSSRRGVGGSTERPASLGPASFVVDVRRLRQRPGEVLRVERQGVFAELAVTSSWVPDGHEVVTRAQLEAVSDGVIVHATVEADWEGECRRCLGVARGRLRAEVRELYADDGDPELDYPLAGDRLDLGLLSHDAVILGLPPAPLCREGCEGLCPVCGADRNEGDCGCETGGGGRSPGEDARSVEDARQESATVASVAEAECG